MFAQRNICILLVINFLFHLVGSISNCTNVYITDSEGVITSPDYPRSYPDKLSCSWYIAIPRNTSLSISVIDLDIEPNDFQECPDVSEETTFCCINNWLSVPVATNPHSPQLLCGERGVQPIHLPDTLQKASIKFHSSKNMRGNRGFKLKYAIVRGRHMSCTNSEFECADERQCVEKIHLCDGKHDCEDKSDEHGCEKRCTMQGLSSCPDQPHICYNATSSVCAQQQACGPEEWILCKDGKACYHKEHHCDKIIQCDDQSDETNCIVSAATTLDIGIFYMCDNWKWVSSLKVCDGIDDCGDHSDEDGCVRPSLETAIILGCLSCSLLFILIASYAFHAHHHHRHQRALHHRDTVPRIRPFLNINSHAYIMPFREPPPPYPMDPPSNRRRYRRHRRHPRSSSAADTIPPATVPLDEHSESPNQEEAATCTWKAPEEQQEGTTSTE